MRPSESPLYGVRSDSNAPAQYVYVFNVMCTIGQPMLRMRTNWLTERAHMQGRDASEAARLLRRVFERKLRFSEGDLSRALSHVGEGSRLRIVMDKLLRGELQSMHGCIS